MNMREDEAISAESIEQAAAWMYRIQGAAVDAPIYAELARWQAADPMNARSWRLAQRAWMLSGQVEPATAEDGSRSAIPWRRRGARRGLFASHRRRGVVRRFAAPAIAATLALAMIAPSIALRLRSDYVTETAENRQVRLPDGSEVLLGADSAAVRRFSSGQRGVEMLRGEAWFEVAHDDHRPFVVSAGDMRVTVTGTAFDVAMTGDTLSVGLARGGIRVDRSGQTTLHRDLRPGERLEIDRRSGAAVVSQVAPATLGIWRDGRLAVENASFADVVSTLDRHYRGTIVVAGAAMKTRRVTGVFDLHDPVRALRALIQPYGGTIHRITPWVIVLTPA